MARLAEPEKRRRPLTSWRAASWAGTLSALEHACWFTVFALVPVGLVRAMGQVEVVVTLCAYPVSAGTLRRPCWRVWRRDLPVLTG